MFILLHELFSSFRSVLQESLITCESKYINEIIQNQGHFEPFLFKKYYIVFNDRKSLNVYDSL